jgi:hypothetical protein
MDWLLLSAVLLQGLDAGYTCHKLNQGGYHETNPLLGNTCKDIIIRKTLFFTPLIIWNNKAYKVGLIVGGGIGLSVSIALDKR